MKSLKLIFTTLFVLIVFAASAQKSLLKQATKYYKAEKYQEALDLFNKIDDKDQDKSVVFQIGVCNYYVNNTDLAIQNFMNARSMGYDNGDIYYYAAKAFHSKNLFVDASRFYKNYLRYAQSDEDQNKVIELIKQCKFGIDNQYNDQIAFVENLGLSVNTEYDEINPVQSPTSQNKYYFSSNRSGSQGGLRNMNGYKDEIYGKYSSDMYAVELSNGNWTPVSAFHPILNGPKNDIIEGFNPDGSVMYFLKSQDGKTGQIYADTFSIDKDPEAFPKQFLSPMIAELGDKDLQVFNNNTLIFSSKRKGGYGGFDLYISVLKEGEWSVPENLGPKINSRYDEVSPFLTKSGTKLYFSSDRIESFGCFDIYMADFNVRTKKWLPPSNLGVPINSANDDLHFSVSSDGMTAVFASDRPDSNGGSDLYLAYFKNQITAQLMYTEEVPFIKKEKAVAANGDSSVVQSDTLLVDNNESDDNEKEVITQKEFIISPLYYGNDEIIIHPINKGKMDRVKDLMIIYPELHITFSGHSTKEGMSEFDLYFSIKRSEKAADYLVKNGINPNRISVKGLGSNYPHTIQTGSQPSMLAAKNNRRIDISFSNIPAQRLSIIDERPTASDNMKDVAFETYSNTITDLAYKIQIAKTKQMFKGDVIRQYNSGIIEKKLLDDNYTYTLGVFDTYRQARVLKSELLRKGILDAKVIPYVNGEAINDQQIQEMKDTYSDLNEYLKFETE